MAPRQSDKQPAAMGVTDDVLEAIIFSIVQGALPEAKYIRTSTLTKVRSGCVLIQASNVCPVPSKCFSLLAPWLRAARLSSSLSKLFAAYPTVVTSFTSPYGMFLFLTLSNGDICIHHLTTHEAETHRHITTAVIVVRAPGSLHYLPFLLSLPDYQLSENSTIVPHSSLPGHYTGL